MIKFEWDPGEARINLSKHGVDSEEARTVFFDDYARQFFDKVHFAIENRFLMLGLSNRSRMLMVVHCERERYMEDETDKELTIRTLSARKATATERAFYEGPLP